MIPSIDGASPSDAALGLLLESELDRLRAKSPYDRISLPVLCDLLAQAEVVFHQHDKVICQPAVAEDARRLNR
jgi:hypothetical protein